MTPTVFKTALRPDEGKGQSSPSIKQLSADALVFFAAGMSASDAFHADQNLIWHFPQELTQRPIVWRWVPGIY
jgi:hypothetical protein